MESLSEDNNFEKKENIENPSEESNEIPSNLNSQIENSQIENSQNENSQNEKENENSQNQNINSENIKKELTEEEKKKKDQEDLIATLPLYITSCKLSLLNNEQVVLYTLKGLKVKSQIQRRYSDFELLRKKIGEFLPGVFIAGLPSTEILGDVDNKASEMRLKLLNHFIRKITENPELYETEPFIFFLNDDKNYRNFLEKLDPGNPEEIKNRFLKVFPDFKYENYNKIEFEKYLDYWIKIFIKARDNIDKIGIVLENEILNIIKEQKMLSHIFKMFIDFENAIPNNQSIIKNPKEFCANIINSNLGRPYFVFYHYHLKTIADLEAFIDAYKILVKYRKKFSDSQDALKKISLSGLSKYNVLKASKEEGVQQLTQEDKGYYEELKMLNLKFIVDISTTVLKKQIDNFRETFFERYKNEIVKMKQNLINKNLKSVQLWEEFASSLN